MSTIIRAVTEHAQPAPDTEALVTIDARTGQAVPRPSIFGMMTGDFRFFLVSNNRDQQRVVKGTKHVKYKEGQEELTLAITYRGSCRPRQEWQLAQFFFKQSSSETAVADALARWLIEYFSSGTTSIDDFDAERASAAATLATRASQELGLELAIDLQLETPGNLETISFGPLLVSSRLKGSDEEEGIWFKAELEVDPQRVPRALLSQKRTFTDLLKKGVSRYCADRVTLDAYYDGLASEQIRQGLRDYLNDLLRPVGRRVGFLSLKPDADHRPDTFKGETVVEYNHHEFPDPIKIKASVLMIPTNPARYKAKGSPKLNQWLDATLRDVINLTLFGLSYVDLLLEFPRLKDEIGRLTNQRAEEIGYVVKQLMTIPYLEPFEWLKRIDIEIKGSTQNNGQPAEAMFEMSLSNFYVGLEIFLTARIKDLRGISHFLSAKQDVPQRMKEEIIRLVRRFMHRTDPERFYMRYSRADNAGNQPRPSEPPFEEELRQKIHYLLETEFNAQVIDLVLKPMQTDLMRKFAEVSRGAHDFAAVAELGSLPGALTITVKGSFRVHRVSGWPAFKECDVSAEAVRKRIEDSIRARLKGAREDQFTFAEQTGLDPLIEDVLGKTRDLIRDEFGLIISLTTVYWDWDDELKKFGRQNEENELASIQERIRSLREILLEHIEQGSPPEDRQEIEERIRRLSAMLKPMLASSTGIQQLAEPKPAKSLPAADPDQNDGTILNDD